MRNPGATEDSQDTPDSSCGHFNESSLQQTSTTPHLCNDKVHIDKVGADQEHEAYPLNGETLNYMQ